MDEQFVRVHVSGGYITVERGIPKAFCGHSFPLEGCDGCIADEDLREMVKLLRQAWAGELWEGEEVADEEENVINPD